ncbi:hypothetical protein [Kordiimonas marina]|uniref:hypothetical protein n=1 Tax=Kordiimonas marina TaxID=2872312 RepID=UPI001FF623C5|nr:hypothetical protein [Kordiimonas marina]MCJ9428175.1 hypothetical protein [Kordiimonas marina]
MKSLFIAILAVGILGAPSAAIAQEIGRLPGDDHPEGQLSFPGLPDEKPSSVNTSVQYLPLRDCLFSATEPAQKLTPPAFYKKAKTCDHFLAQYKDKLTPDQRYAVAIARVKLDYEAHNYTQMKADLAEAQNLTNVPDDPLETHIRQQTVEALDIFVGYFDKRSPVWLKRARAFSNANPDFVFAHMLYENIAFKAHSIDDVIIGYQRLLRISPSDNGFISLALILQNQGRPDEASQLLIHALSSAELHHDLGNLLIAYSRSEGLAHRFDNASQLLSMLSPEMSGEKARTLQRQVFAQYPSLANRHLWISKSYSFNEDVKLETAYNKLERGDIPGAVSIAAKQQLVCTNLRCMKLEAAVAEAAGDHDKADKLKEKIAHSVDKISNVYANNWETSFILGLPSIPLEHFTTGYYFGSPKVRSYSYSGSTLTVEVHDDNPMGAYRVWLETMRAAQKAASDKGVKSFLLQTVTTGYSYKNSKKFGKSFSNYSATFNILPVTNDNQDTAQLAAWRQIAVK